MKKAFSKILLIFILAAILGAAYFIWEAIAAKKNQGPTSKVPDIQVIAISRRLILCPADY